MNKEQLSILIVDDEPSILEFLSRLLSMKNCYVDTANNGMVALKKLEHIQYSAVITDINMPGLSGIELFEHIRMKGTTPVIGMTGTPWLIKNTKFNAVLNKPFNRKELFEIIDRLI